MPHTSSFVRNVSEDTFPVDPIAEELIKRRRVDQAEMAVKILTILQKRTVIGLFGGGALAASIVPSALVIGAIIGGLLATAFGVYELMKENK